jgi:hypothetical protein
MLVAKPDPRTPTIPCHLSEERLGVKASPSKNHLSEKADSKSAIRSLSSARQMVCRKIKRAVRKLTGRFMTIVKSLRSFYLFANSEVA